MYILNDRRIFITQQNSIHLVIIETSPLHFTCAEQIIEAPILNLIQFHMQFMHHGWLHLYHVWVLILAPPAYNNLQSGETHSLCSLRDFLLICLQANHFFFPCKTKISSRNIHECFPASSPLEGKSIFACMQCIVGSSPCSVKPTINADEARHLHIHSQTYQKVLELVTDSQSTLTHTAFEAHSFFSLIF